MPLVSEASKAPARRHSDHALEAGAIGPLHPAGLGDRTHRLLSAGIALHPIMGLPVILETGMVDGEGRRLEYARISLTDACNFRCVYCLPNGPPDARGKPPVLNRAEVAELVRALAALGVHKVRFTGGEPTLRKDLVNVVSNAAATPGIRTVALSTNGWNLAQLARPLADAGLNAVNISVDSLDPAAFAAITGRGNLPEVLRGIHAALDAGLRVKLNAVVLQEFHAAAVTSLMALTEHLPLGVRFIELMRTGGNGPFHLRQHQPLDALAEQLRERGYQPVARTSGAGPAEEWKHPNHAGTVGMIAPYRRNFCATCNRVRFTCRGELRLCLFGDDVAPVRHLLTGAHHHQLTETLAQLAGSKPVAHRLHEGHCGSTPNLAATGG